MSFQDVMSNEKARNYTGLHPIKAHQPSLSCTNRAQGQFLSLSLSAGKTHCHVLVIRTALNLLIYILP